METLKMKMMINKKSKVNKKSIKQKKVAQI